MGPGRDDPVGSPEAPMRPPELPEGVVTFLLTDIEGSTPLWETHTAAMSMALARHEALVTEVVASYGGRLIKSRGEGGRSLGRARDLRAGGRVGATRPSSRVAGPGRARARCGVRRRSGR
jgi:class 3 adenylate cyclase